jgi:hypothetical protein
MKLRFDILTVVRYCLLACDAIQSGRYLLLFWRNLLLPFSWKSKTGKKRSMMQGREDRLELKAVQ